MFHITAAQLTKVVTGVDYESGPHSSAKKRKATETDATASDKVATTSKPAQQEDTLSISSDSESLPDVPFK